MTLDGVKPKASPGKNGYGRFFTESIMTFDEFRKIIRKLKVKPRKKRNK